MSKRRASVEYQAWSSMKSRCFYPKGKFFKDYAGRGITVCHQWVHDFKQFLVDMGPRPSAEHSMDRRDNNGSYTPENCRWATPEEQQSNRRNSDRYNLITLNGTTQTRKAWAASLGITVSGLKARLKSRSWTLEEALTLKRKTRQYTLKLISSREPKGQRICFTMRKHIQAAGKTQFTRQEFIRFGETGGLNCFQVDGYIQKAGKMGELRRIAKGSYQVSKDGIAA